MDKLVAIIITFAALVQISLATTNITIQCGNLTCSHDSKCRNDSSGNYYCQCHQGFKGETCQEDDDECERGVPCYHRGICHNTIGSWWCECLDGWNDTDHCSENVTEVRDCMPGWRGDWCQDQCYEDSHCGTNKQCFQLHSGDYRCSCISGWSGRNCTDDRDECTTRNPCRNSGTCINTQGSYHCLCPDVWTGTNCDTDLDECTTNTCVHTDNCTNHVGSFTCQCSRGWHGNYCSDDVNECATNPCNETLVCQNTQGSYVCVNPPALSKDKSSVENIGLVVGICMAALVVILIVVLALLYVFKWKPTSGNKVAEQ